MKKWIVTIALLLVVAAVAAVLIGVPPMHSEDASGEVMWYDYQQKTYRVEKMTAEEVAIVVQILKKSKPDSIFIGEYGCGYDTRLSFTIGGTTYYQAQDDCGCVQNAGTGRYYEIDGESHDVIDEIFRAHGAEI